MEKTYCDKCGKEITKEVKYTTVGLYGWYCSKCYFGGVEMTDDDLKNKKIAYNYE